MKVIFVHPVRTAGSTINEYFRARDPDGVRISWDRINRDWLIDEMRELLSDERATFIHQHAGNWSEERAGWFRERGWKMMISIRHVGDQLCSLYYHAPEMKSLLSVDEFVREQIQGGTVPTWTARQWVIPTWAVDPDLIVADPFTDMQRILGFTMPGLRLNVSDNPGWEKLVELGEIRPDTAVMVNESGAMQRYWDFERRRA